MSNDLPINPMADYMVTTGAYYRPPDPFEDDNTCPILDSLYSECGLDPEHIERLSNASSVCGNTSEREKQMSIDRSCEIEVVLGEQDVANSNVSNKKEQVIRDIRRGLSNLMECVRGNRDEFTSELAGILDGYSLSLQFWGEGDEEDDGEIVEIWYDVEESEEEESEEEDDEDEDEEEEDDD